MDTLSDSWCNRNPVAVNKATDPLKKSRKAADTQLEIAFAECRGQ